MNGGEPTTHPELAIILKRAVQSGAKVTLFTNGRSLRHLHLAENILVSGLHRISVPLYGSSASKHDALTNIPGSFEQTVQGLDRIFSAQKRMGFPSQVELKLLALRPSLEDWPEIVSFIYNHWGNPDRIILSGIIISHEVSLRRDILIPTLVELKLHIQLTLKQMAINQMKPYFWNIPLCVLDPANREMYPKKVKHETGGYLDIYADPKYPQGIQINPSEQANLLCKRCLQSEECGGYETFYAELERASQLLSS